VAPTLSAPHGLRFEPSLEPASSSADALIAAAKRCRETAYVVEGEDRARSVAFGGQLGGDRGLTVLGVLPPLFPEWLGDRRFTEAHGCRFPYVVGEMANGIATAKMVVAATRAGFLGFFGAAGLPPDRVNAAIDEIEAGIAPGAAYGVNLIHSPHEPDTEDAVVDVFLRRGVTRVSASAYMELTPMIVRYAATGLTRGTDGVIHRRHFVFAKVSRAEVAAHFLAPMPESMLQELVAQGRLTSTEAELARQLPVATDITVEADSGGHTDNQALPCVFPTIKLLVEKMQKQHHYKDAIRVGAAGGIGTPDAVAAAFAMGASYVLTGSVNQSAVESGLSPGGRELLCGVRLGDVTMAPAADMFEMGVKVQVLKKGSMFSNRAHKLYDIYKQYASIEEIPVGERARLEKDIFRASLEDMWRSTHDFFSRRDPSQIEKADANPRHKMALIFRSYLGQASKWAIHGDASRALDFQIWCGPAMGSFNAWVDGTYLAASSARTVTQIGLNLLEGAAIVTRAQQLRTFGCAVPDAAFLVTPRPFAEHMETA
jgi:trans-AT polyketide synthase, acyltransferase and oxidoreductase domains